jgi:hypothetical protein
MPTGMSEVLAWIGARRASHGLVRSDPIRSDPIRSDPIRSGPIRSGPIREE